MKLAVAVPTGNLAAICTMQLLRLPERHPDWELGFFTNASSVLTFNFNECWCWALNLREHDDIDYFLMLHDDVRPRPDNWFDLLWQEMQASKADVLSAIIPIKDRRGLTSTAFDTDLWCPQRLTLGEASRLPKTWTAPGLLINTGCLLVDFTRPWVEKICFTMRDKLERDVQGVWRPFVQPEDWDFSRQCHRLGVKLFATRAVPIDHYGTQVFSSDMVWGDQHDEQNGRGPLPEIIGIEP